MSQRKRGGGCVGVFFLVCSSWCVLLGVFFLHVGQKRPNRPFFSKSENYLLVLLYGGGFHFLKFLAYLAFFGFCCFLIVRFYSSLFFVWRKKERIHIHLTIQQTTARHPAAASSCSNASSCGLMRTPANHLTHAHFVSCVCPVCSSYVCVLLCVLCVLLNLSHNNHALTDERRHACVSSVRGGGTSPPAAAIYRSINDGIALVCVIVWASPSTVYHVSDRLWWLI